MHNIPLLFLILRYCARGFSGLCVGAFGSVYTTLIVDTLNQLIYLDI